MPEMPESLRGRFRVTHRRTVKPILSVPLRGMATEVSDFQKGTFVHMTDEDTDLIGEIKELDNGKLQVDFEGKQKMLGIDMSCLFVLDAAGLTIRIYSNYSHLVPKG
jgi:hypothetical protein